MSQEKDWARDVDKSLVTNALIVSWHVSEQEMFEARKYVPKQTC